MVSKMNMDDGIAEVWDVKLGMKMEVDFALMRKGKVMFKVPNGQDPYSVIGKYIRDHITAIEDIIAVIKINEVETNQLFMVDINEENYFIWKTDWWEGEEDVTLIDFFPVSEAQHANQSVQSADTISRQAAIEAIFNEPLCESGMKERTAIAVILAIYEKIKSLPSAQPTEASCWGCNCPKMERLKEQKTFSEMVHLHDAETHEKRTETHSCDCIERQAVINKLETVGYDFSNSGLSEIELEEVCEAVGDVRQDMISMIKRLPSVQPEPLSDAYTKAVWTWLLDYQIKAVELKGRYTPYEVLSWVANDWRKEHERSD